MYLFKKNVVLVHSLICCLFDKRSLMHNEYFDSSLEGKLALIIVSTGKI